METELLYSNWVISQKSETPRKDLSKLVSLFFANKNTKEIYEKSKVKNKIRF